MNRVVTCLFAGAMSVSLHAAAMAQDEAPAAESKPVPLAGTDPAEYVDLLAEGSDGEVLGVVFDVVLDDSGKATTIVVELFGDEEMGMAEGEEGAEGEEAAAPPESEFAAEDQVEEEPEPLAADEAEGDEGEAEGTEEPIFVGKLVGVSPKGAMIDSGRDVIILASVTAVQAEELDEFMYETGMKTVAYPEGYPAEAPAEE